MAPGLHIRPSISWAMLTIGFNMSANLVAQVPLLSIDFTFVIEKSQIGGCIRLTATDSLQIKLDNQL
jgi:hypothetical protein